MAHPRQRREGEACAEQAKSQKRLKAEVKGEALVEWRVDPHL
jgi:hypothetical protein